MFDSLLWVLSHFVTHYAGQTNQGNKDDGDDANQASGSKDAPKQDTDLPPRPDYLRLKRPLQESNILDQSGASSSVDFQPKKVCKGGHRIRKISSPCSQQQSPPELRPSTSYDPPQSNRMPLPAIVGESEVESYNQDQDIEQYDAFTESEAKYFKSEYSLKRKLGEGQSGVVYLAIKKSNGKKVAYKSISKSDEYEYALESIPPPRCHLPSPIGRSEEQSVEQCMLPRPPNLLVPYEFMIQKYLSRPGYDNPYVPVVFDYIILEDEYILVMEYCDESWVNLAKYVEKKGRLDIEEARHIIKEIVNGMISLKQHGILHHDLTGRVKLIDFGVTGILPGWEDGKSVPLKSSDSPSPTVSEYEAGDSELWRMHTLGNLLYRIITPKGINIGYSDDEQEIRETIPDESDPYKHGLREKAISLIDVLVSSNTDTISSIEAILDHSFFQLNNKE
ncbi:hypothetical protein BASA61_004875 [Batrachochytrium salamandrivorans]|nr:hypothetical protein BASA60_000104 [Batrachochytrium salamandrivorans]KAH6575492.1 hypothetical protein BASA62_001883 [Batrachochytrium salamandrivorans]KAH6591676.1 hypothetical protein BASA61_004875 [Batrachochytrium salamandrivorans]